MSSSRRRSGLPGYIFLGLAVLVASLTVFLAFSDRSLADLSAIIHRDNEEQDARTAEFVATVTVEADPVPTPNPLLIPEDVGLSARAALVTHLESGDVLFELDADEPLQPASTAKVISAIVVLENASSDEVVEIIESDVVDPVDESSMGLQAGDRITIHDLLVGLMLPSGNDAANALARTIGSRLQEDDSLPPEERFIQEMNAVAEELGMENANLLHPAGHDRDEQAVTARQLAVAAEALLARPSLQPIVSMLRADVKVGGPNERVLTVYNTNELLAHDDVFGVKTGTTVEAGQCLIVARRNGGETYLAVILGSEDRYADAQVLLNLPDLIEPELEDQDGVELDDDDQPEP